MAVTAFARNTVCGFFIWFFFVAEVLLLTFCRNSFGPYLSPLAFYGSGLMLAMLCYRYFQAVPVVVNTGPAVPVRRQVFIWVWNLGLWGWLALRLQKIIVAFPIQIERSDIIPALQVYVARFLAGEKIYTPFHELGYTGTPGYMPLQWLPYVPAQVLGLDYRWLAFGVLLLGMGAYTFRLLRQEKDLIPLLGKAALPALLLWAILVTDPSTLGLTVETLVYGYYLLLMASLFGRSPAWQILGLLLCLLSRYALVLWVPLYLLLLYFLGQRRQALLVAGGVAAGVLLLYVLPFLLQDWGMFLRVQQEYTQLAVGEWMHLETAAETGDKPYHLFKGLGAAAWFYTWGKGTLAERVLLLKQFHFFFSALAVVGAGIFYFRSQVKIDYRLFALISLKIYLATFYHFIQVPYLYLTALSVFASVFLLLFLPGRHLFPRRALAPAEQVPAFR